jgi:hypothetical protein
MRNQCTKGDACSFDHPAVTVPSTNTANDDVEIVIHNTMSPVKSISEVKKQAVISIKDRLGPKKGTSGGTITTTTTTTTATPSRGASDGRGGDIFSKLGKKSAGTKRTRSSATKPTKDRAPVEKRRKLKKNQQLKPSVKKVQAKKAPMKTASPKKPAIEDLDAALDAYRKEMIPIKNIKSVTEIAKQEPTEDAVRTVVVSGEPPAVTDTFEEYGSDDDIDDLL